MELKLFEMEGSVEIEVNGIGKVETKLDDEKPLSFPLCFPVTPFTRSLALTHSSSPFHPFQLYPSMYASICGLPVNPKSIGRVSSGTKTRERELQNIHSSYICICTGVLFLLS